MGCTEWDWAVERKQDVEIVLCFLHNYTLHVTMSPVWGISGGTEWKVKRKKKKGEVHYVQFAKLCAIQFISIGQKAQCGRHPQGNTVKTRKWKCRAAPGPVSDALWALRLLGEDWAAITRRQPQQQRVGLMTPPVTKTRWSWLEHFWS